jgi:hypothetical protein
MTDFPSMPPPPGYPYNIRVLEDTAQSDEWRDMALWNLRLLRSGVESIDVCPGRDLRDLRSKLLQLRGFLQKAIDSLPKPGARTGDKQADLPAQD